MMSNGQKLMEGDWMPSAERITNTNNNENLWDWTK